MDDEYIPTKKELYDLVVDLFRERQHKEMENTIISQLQSVYGHGTTKEYNQKFEQELESITPDVFRSFLIAKGVSGQCVACGSDKLSTPETGKLRRDKLPKDFASLSMDEKVQVSKHVVDTHVSHISLSDIDSPNYRTRTYFIVHCLNCGYLSLYRTRTVMKWFEDNNTKESGNEQG